MTVFANRTIGVVDYGAGNLFSVERGLRASGCDAVFISDPNALGTCDAILLPGVGAFAAGMQMLESTGLAEAVRSFASTGRPVLGICLGMQFLMSRSFEYGIHDGLNLIPGDVVQLQAQPEWRVPNIGWHRTRFLRNPAPLPFRQTDDETYFYFAHSYHCVPGDPRDVVATIDWADQPIAAIVSRDNVHGCQFHPEISAEPGIRIYQALQSLSRSNLI